MILSSKDTTPARASRRWSAVAAAGVLGLAAVLSGVGFAQPAQDEKPAPQEKPKDAKPAPKDDVQVGPPPQLEALRKAVEAAAKKGENVDDIRKQLDELEKALAGKAWKRPAVAPDAPPVPAAPGFAPMPAFQNFARPGVVVPPGAFAPPPGVFAPPNFPMAFDFQFGMPNNEAMKKANEALELAMKALANNPNDLEVAEKAMKEYQRLMLDALPNANVFGGGGAVVVGPDGQVQRFGFGDRPAARPVERAVTVRNVNDGRMGIQIDKVPALVVEQLGLDAGAGLVVSGVRDGSAAAKAGLKANDIILEFAGKPVTDNLGDFVRAVAAVKKGEKVDVTVLRKGKKEAVKGIELPDVPEGRGRPMAAEIPAGRDIPPRPGVAVAPPPPAEPPSGRPVPPAPPAEARAEFSSTSVSVNNGDFTIKAEANGVTFTITGALEGGKAVPSKIAIADGDTKVDADSLEKVPAAYRDRVSVLLRSVRGGR